MKKTLLALAALLSICSVRADDIIVYKQNLKVSVTGGGYAVKRSITGWTVLDGFTGQIAIIEAEKSRKRFFVEEPDLQIQICSGPNGKEYTVFNVTSGRFKGLALKGQNKTIDIFVLTPYEIPSRATATGTDLYQMNGEGDFYFDEYKGSLVYDKKNTNTPFNRTFAEKVQQLKNDLLASGYTEEI